MKENTQANKKFPTINALTLKIFAIAFMLCDHIWAAGILPYNILTYIGRIAFPIFAFQIVEGFYHTKDIKRYLRRLFLFALISEIPFNMVIGGSFFYPFHQNVLFNFFLSLEIIRVIEWAKKKGKFFHVIIASACAIIGYFLGFLTLVDYFGYGILTVLVFYFARDSKFKHILELVGLFIIHWDMIGGLVFLVPFFGMTLEIPEQGLALLSLPLIWLYNGKQGPHNKAIQYAYYAFYPAHLLILGIIAKILFL